MLQIASQMALTLIGAILSVLLARLLAQNGKILKSLEKNNELISKSNELLRKGFLILGALMVSEDKEERRSLYNQLIG